MKKVFFVFIITIFTATAFGQELLTVYGYVKNDYGQPIKNVKVASQEKFSSTYTDANGWYKFQVPVSDTILWFAHKEYETVKIPHTGASRFDVELIPLNEGNIEAREAEEDGEGFFNALRGLGKKISPTAMCNGAYDHRPQDWNT
nr:hypothetical protein [Bacteroidota bacterium]